MSVENGVALSVFQKDYELLSWNEQGEITQIEGMLTIAFLFISLCPHIDRRKELYLIIKIPYLVNMSTEQKIEPKRVELQPVNLLKAFHEQRDEIEKLKLEIESIGTANTILKENFEKLENKFNQLSKENIIMEDERTKFKNEILRLKIISGETKSSWIKERDCVYRNNPETGEPDSYSCPIVFNRNDVRDLKIFINERKNEKWCSYTHPYPRSTSSYKSFDMPHTAYLSLKGELPEQKKDRVKKTESIEIKEYDDLIEHIELFGIFEYSFRKLENVFNFLKEHEGKTFQRQYFTGNCDISSRTVSKYLKMLEKCKLIIKLPVRGKYKVK